ncbi:MAG: DUF2125 domain-containing protein [Alphaproteobacteria bacterium]
MTFRNAARVLFVVFSILLAGYGGYWVYARGVAETIVQDWIEDHRAAGYRIEHAPLQLDGFPFLIRVTLDGPLVAHKTARWAWRAGSLVIEAQPWRLNHIRGEVIGAQSLEVAADGAAPKRFFTFNGETVGVAQLRDGHLSALDFSARNFDLREKGVGPLVAGQELWIGVTAPNAPPRGHLDPLVSVTFSGANIGVANMGFAPFGNRIERSSGVATVRGVAPPGPVAAVIDAWRRDGGAVDVGVFRIVWGPLDLKSSGTLALDDQLRPLGAFTANVRDFTKVVDALVDGKLIERGVATMAKIGLGLMAKPDKDGGASILTVPLSAQDGKLYAGPLKILDLAPLPIPALSP